MSDNKIQFIKDDEIDLKALFQVLWNDRKRIIQITVVVTLIGIIYALSTTPLYKSTITMYPSGQESGGKLSQLQGMASTFGFDVGGGEPSFNIPDIVESRRLKTKLIYRKWNSDKFDTSVNLIHYWGIDDITGISLNPINWIKALFASSGNEKLDNTLEWETAALEELNGRISVNENKSGLISVEILMEEPEIAADIVNIIYETIVAFTVETHSKQAKLNREFIEMRKIEVKEQLTESEDALKVFRERNRNIIESPQLQLEIERLIRDVEIKTQIYITLQQQYELVSIEEVKETPSVLVLDEGKPAVTKDQPKRKPIVFMAMFLGGFLSISISLFNRT